MRSLKHSKIFYKDDRESLISLTKGIAFKDDPLFAAILPICSIERVENLYREVLSHVENPKRIIVICPLHRERLIEDENEILFSYPECEIESEIGTIRVSGSPFKVQEAYISEEPGGELLLPFIKGLFDGVELYVLFSSIKSSKEIKEATERIRELVTDDTVIFIMSNLTSKSQNMETDRDKSVSFILSGEPLLDKYEKKEAPFLGAPLVEIANRIQKGEWRLVSASSSGDKNVSHGALYKVRE